MAVGVAVDNPKRVAGAAVESPMRMAAVENLNWVAVVAAGVEVVGAAGVAAFPAWVGVKEFPAFAPARAGIPAGD